MRADSLACVFCGFLQCESYHLLQPLCVLGAAAVGMVVEVDLHLLAFGPGLGDDGGKVCQFCIRIIVAVAA